MSEIKTIKMQRTEWVTGEVQFADVHPDEVQNWQAGGWQIAALDAKPATIKDENIDGAVIKPTRRKRNA